MRSCYLAVAAIPLLWLTNAAGAQSDQKAGPVLDALAACRRVAAAEQRAACYDAAYDEIVRARDRKEFVIVDRQGVRETRKGLFGFAGPRLPFFGDNDEDTPKEVSSTIAGIQEIARDVYRIRLADGAVWQTTDEMTGIPKKGGAIQIRRTAMGGYALSLGRGRAVRAIRIQ